MRFFNTAIEYQTFINTLPKPQSGVGLSSVLKYDQIYIPAGNYQIRSSHNIGKHQAVFIHPNARLAFSPGARWTVDGEIYLGLGQRLPSQVRFLNGQAYPYALYVNDQIIAAGIMGSGSPERSLNDLLGKSLRNKRLIVPSLRLGTLPFNVIRGNGGYYTDLDSGNFVTGLVMYINRAIGNNSNDGLTPATPKQSLASAINAGARVIYVTGTTPYTNTHCLWDTIVWPDADVAIIGLGPRPQFICGDIPSSWTVVGGHANCYSATVSNPINVVDLATLDSRGNPTPLTVRADQTALDAAAEGFFISGSTAVTVKLTDLTQPTSTRLAVTRSSRLIPKHNVAGRSVYLQNIAIIADRPFWIDSPDGIATDYAKN